MQNILNALLNTILVSIPEELIFVFFTMILMKRFDLIDFRRWRENLKWIAIPVIPTAILINICRYILLIPKPLVTLICTAVLITLIIYVIKKNNFMSEKFIIIKVILFYLLSLVILMIIEGIYIPVILAIMNKQLQDINNNVITNFLFSLPCRILQVYIIAILIYRKSYSQRLKFLVNITKNKVVSISLSIFILLIICSWVSIVYVIMDNKILEHLNLYLQILITSVLTSIPVLLIGIVIILVVYFFKTISLINKSHQNTFGDDI